MEIHELDRGRVITLAGHERFLLPQPGRAAFRVDTVSVLRGEEPYFTVANATDGELDQRFTDSGPLPPHVRTHVEDMVPVVDRPDTVIGGDYSTTSNRGTDQQRVSSPSTADRQAQRRARFQLLDGGGQADVLAAHRPSEPNRLGKGFVPEPEQLSQEVTHEMGAWRRLGAPAADFRPLAPSQFLDTAQVRDRGGR